MNALDKLDKKFDAGEMTNLDLCVFWHFQIVPLDVAERAAAELADIRAALDEAREIIKCHYTIAAAAWLTKYPKV